MAVGSYLRSYRSAAASDRGRKRSHNEDRCYVDAERGIYAVIDGVGGQAAGEQAATAAVDVLRERLERPSGTPAERLTEAIALANNEIWRMSQTRPEWAGMACVLTIALIEDDVVTVGHVGDSRLYLLRPGEIRKITHDHSPVGEREDRGEISELEAMRHSRRNEIFRDVGSSEKSPGDSAFIELTSFPMPSDGALLLCTDGLTDLISSEEVRAGVERYAPDYEAAIRALIDAANHAGGKDNVTVVLVAGADYRPQSGDETEPRSRARSAFRLAGPWRWAALGLLVGAALTGLATFAVSRFVPQGPQTFTAGSGGIGAALMQAHSGDTVVIPEGRYRERIELRGGVDVRARQPGTVTLVSPDGGAAVVARNIESGSLTGVWIQGDLAAPLSKGIEIVDASPSISNVKVTGAGTGIEVRGAASSPSVTSSQITNNLGTGIAIGANAKPRIEGNLIAANGTGRPGEAQPGVEVGDHAHPILKNNGIVNNGAAPIWLHGREDAPADVVENFFGGLTAAEAIRRVDEERAAAEAQQALKSAHAGKAK